MRTGERVAVSLTDLCESEEHNQCPTP